MGAVYLASDQRLPTNWAIKEMKKEGFSQAEQESNAELFRAEARLLSELRHRNLPRIVDFFEEGQQLYLVMDYVEGETLEDRIARDGPLTPSLALELCLQITDVLDYLHSLKDPVIFRDFKPANVMLTPQNEVKLIDFGIARIFRQGQSSDTQALGTPGYAAPEQYGKGQSGPRTDLYAFGATFHHALSGRDPTNEPFVFPPLEEFRSDLPPQLNSIVGSCLNLQPSDRPESAFAIKRQLEQVLLQTGSSPLVAGRPSTIRLEAIPETAAPPETSAAPASEATSVATTEAVPTAEAGSPGLVLHTVPIGVGTAAPPPEAAEEPAAPEPSPAPAPAAPSAPSSDSNAPEPDASTSVFRPGSVSFGGVAKGRQVRRQVAIKSAGPVELTSDLEALGVMPSQVPSGQQRITITLDTSALNPKETLRGSVQSSCGAALTVEAEILESKASLGRTLTAVALCLMAFLPLVNYLSTLMLGMLYLSTPKGPRSSLAFSWWFAVFLTFCWTLLFAGLAVGIYHLDWSFLELESLLSSPA